MTIVDSLLTFFHYFVHPFRSNELLATARNEKGQGKLIELDLYESLGISWSFVVISAMIRIFFIFLIVNMFYYFQAEATSLNAMLFQGHKHTGFYFLVLSTVLEVIFYPLITLFFIELWKGIIKFYARIMHIDDHEDEMINSIMSVSLSSNLFLVVPIFGDMAQKIASTVFLYAGLRKQLNFSAPLAIVVICSPALLLTMFLSVMMLFAMVS